MLITFWHGPAMHKVMCIYKSLQEDHQAPCSFLTFEEFSHLYENLGLSWKMVRLCLYSCLKLTTCEGILSLVQDYQASFQVKRFERYAPFRWTVNAIKG